MEDDADGEGEGEREDHEDVREPYGVGPDGEGVPGADRLRYDLSEDDNGEGGGDDGIDAAPEDAVQEDGERAVHEDVAEEQGTEEVVAVPPHPIDEPSVRPLATGAAALHDNLERGGVEGHETQIEAGEQSRQEDENDDEDYLDAEREEGRAARRDLELECGVISGAL